MASVDRLVFRRRRAALPRSVRRDAAAAVARWSRTLPEIAAARRLGAYVPMAGELDPRPIIVDAWRRGASVYLPDVIAPDANASLRFAEHTPDQVLETGAYGIPVPPANAPRLAPAELDLVLVPLVAFDDQGTRAGMGGGFYDRAFSFRATTPAPPLLVGLAYHWQQVDSLVREPWDVALDVVITDRGAHGVG